MTPPARNPAISNSKLLVAIGVVAGGLLIAACSSDNSASISTTRPPSATTSTTSSPITTMPTLPLESQTRGGFYSPSRDIGCEIDDTPPAASIYCQTINPQRSATLNENGSVAVCNGVACLGNPALNTPTLPYGTATGSGSYLCVSEVSGMTCTMAGGKGFKISSAGVTPLGGATVTVTNR